VSGHKPNIQDFEISAPSSALEDFPQDELAVVEGGKYVPPKRRAMEFSDTKTKQEREKERLQSRAKSSRIAKFLQEEYGDTPVEESLKDVTEESREKERRATLEAQYERFEEENFVRIARPKEKKKPRSYMDPFADLADFAPLEYIKSVAQESGLSENDDERFDQVLNKNAENRKKKEA